MAHLRFLSKIEQVAAFLREELAVGKWHHEIPGREDLAIELGVNAKTVESAMRLLEREGLLIPQGAGRRRRISEQAGVKAAMKITFLLYEQTDPVQISYNDLNHRLTRAGHFSTIAEKSLMDLGMDVGRVAKYVKGIETDAWVVNSAPRDILEWFSQQPVPVYAIFGRSLQIPIPSVKIDRILPMQNAVKRLVELGHRRIVLLVRTDRRKPEPGLHEKKFLEALESHGIRTGPYNLPDWENDTDGFHDCLASLFGKTPPTALLLDEPSHFYAAHLFLSRRGLCVPRDVSMICHDPDNSFAWCDPVVSHFRWDASPLVNCVLKWANQIAAGKHVMKRSVIDAEFIEGGTIGPAAGR
jgi:Periplasmic binding protein-like domain/Bacterial regulatory proteins, gntR family